MPQPQTAMAIITGAAYFAVMCTVGTAVGLGILALLRFPVGGARSLLLAPSVATMAWALGGNLLARAGLPIKHAAVLIWLLSAGLAIFGLWQWLRSPRSTGSGWKSAGLLAGITAVVVVVSWPHFTRGLTASLGSSNADTIYYTAAASAYWQFGLDIKAQATTGFFARFVPFFEYAGAARNHTYVLLALLSPIVQAGEPMYVRNLFVCWSLLLMTSGLAFYFVCRRVGTAEPDASTGASAGGYVLLTAGVGWGVIPVLVGNWDNGLLTSVGPVLAGLLLVPPPGPAYPLLMGGVAAYAVYTYPELAPVLAGTLIPFFVYSLVAKDRPKLMRPITTWVTAGAIGLALLAPGIPSLWRFFWAQVEFSTVKGLAIRPGGPFASGLVQGISPSAWWGLGAEHGGMVPSALETLVGALLTGFLLAGIVRWAKSPRQPEIWALGVLGAGLAWFVAVDPYGYAVYKMLSVSWWLVGLCLFDGAATTIRLSRRLARYPSLFPAARATAWLLVLVVLTAALVQADQSRFRTMFPVWAFDAQPTPAGLRRLRQAALAQPETDVLVTGPLAEPIVLPWILYTLRETPLKAVHRPNPELLPTPLENPIDATSTDVPSVVLTTANVAKHNGKARFRTRDFALLDLGAEPMVETMENPNGIEPWGTWLGTKPLVLWLVAGAAMPVSLTFDAVPGPSRPDRSSRTLVLLEGGREIDRRTIDHATPVRFDFKVEAGRTMLQLSCLEQPTVHVLPNGDPRPLLLDLRRIQVQALPG